jgi:hypothetical protein
MPVLTLEKTLEKKTLSLDTLSPVLRAVRRPLRMPAWAIAALVLAIAVTAFAAGRHKPAHHYVPYFGAMVLDTTTGRACYATQPKASDPILEDSAFAIDGTSGPTHGGPTVPLCGQE